MSMPGKGEGRVYPAITRQAMGLGLYSQTVKSGVAVFFRDSDTDNYLDIRKAILNGFRRAEFPHGLPVVPEPTSEAWILCGMECGASCQKFFGLSGVDCKADTPTTCAGKKDWTVKSKPVACSLACPNVCPKRSYKIRYKQHHSAKNLSKDIRGIDISAIKAASFKTLTGDFGNIIGQI